MAFRTEKAIAGAALTLLLASAAWAREFQYPVRHDHLWKSGTGTLTFGEDTLSFAETGKKSATHRWMWAWEDIQQLDVAPGRIRVVTYEDNRWKLGADRELDFELTGTRAGSDLHAFLKNKLDQRLVVRLAEEVTVPLLELPAKQLHRFGGAEGVLLFAADRVVFRTKEKDDSRTWRYADIENVSTSGPFQLTLTTFERAKFHYGDLKGFNFQLKRALDEQQFNEFWLRLNRTKGLQFLADTAGQGEKP